MDLYVDPVERIRLLEITIEHQADYINDLEKEIDHLRRVIQTIAFTVDSAQL